MSSTSPRFMKLHPLPAYTGPQPVYRCEFRWAGSQACLVRNAGTKACPEWQTAEIARHLHLAQFSACPVAGASMTRYAAVMAFDYYYNRKEHR